MRRKTTLISPAAREGYVNQEEEVVVTVRKWQHRFLSPQSASQGHFLSLPHKPSSASCNKICEAEKVEQMVLQDT